MPSTTRPLRGIALLLFALLTFATFDSTSKYLSTRYPVPMLVWVRYALPCLMLALWFGPRERARLVVTRHPYLQVVRALLLLSCTAFGMLAFRTIPLAEATSILFVAPLLVTIGAGPVLGERVRPLAWIANFIGFAGVLLIARPGAGFDLAGVSFMLLAAISFAGYQLLTRKLAASDRSLVTLFYSMMVGAVVMSAGLPFFWTPIAPPPLHVALIVSLGLWGLLGHFLLIRAFAHTPASTLSPFLYFQLVWASLLGWLVFAHLPDLLATIGMGCIAGAGLLLALAHGRRSARAAAAPVNHPAIEAERL